MKPKSKKVVLTFLKITGSILLVLTAVELYLRFPVFGRNPVSIASEEYMQFVHERINPQWANIDNENNDEHPLEPPLKVFSNKEAKNPVRLAEIAKKNRARTNEVLTSYDFLNDPKFSAETKYTACFNNFGFRNCENTNLVKGKNTVRIITYGSYHAFGHGVSEEDTYSNQLQNLLNKSSKTTKYEVLNSGKHAGTAIIGLALIRQDIEKFKPDLVILDYGFCDTAIVSDDVFPVVLLFKDSQFSKLLSRGLNYLINNTRTAYLFWGRVSNIQRKARNMELHRVLKMTIGTALKANIPVVLVRQMPVRLPGAYFEKIQSFYPKKKVAFVDGESAFVKAYSRYENAEVPPYHWWNEIAPENQRLLIRNKYFKFPKLRLAVFQLNKYGHEVMAEELSENVKFLLANRK